MPYTKTNWVANVTPVTAASMNNIENELASLDGGSADHGAELAYGQLTGSVDITTVEPTFTSIITAPAVTFDGATKILLEAWFHLILASVTSNGRFDFFDGAASIGHFAFVSGSNGSALAPLVGRLLLTPSAGSHTFSARGALASAGTWTVWGGAGGAGAAIPSFIRVVRA